MADQGFLVDLDDDDDVTSKHALAADKVEEIDKALARMQELQASRSKWAARRDFLASQLPPDAMVELERPKKINLVEVVRTLEDAESSGVGDLVIAVVENAEEPIRSIKVHEILTNVGHPLTPTMVSNALNYAARAGKIKKVEGQRGYYAKLSWEGNPSINLEAFDEEPSS